MGVCGPPRERVVCVRFNGRLLLKEDLKLVNVDDGNPTCRSRPRPPSVVHPTRRPPGVCFEGSDWAKYQDELRYLELVLARSPQSLGRLMNFLDVGCEKPEIKKKLDGTIRAEIVANKSG